MASPVFNKHMSFNTTAGRCFVDRWAQIKPQVIRLSLWSCLHGICRWNESLTEQQVKNGIGFNRGIMFSVDNFSTRVLRPSQRSAEMLVAVVRQNLNENCLDSLGSRGPSSSLSLTQLLLSVLGISGRKWCQPLVV